MAVDFAQFAQRLGWSFIIIFFKVAQKNVRPSNGGLYEREGTNKLHEINMIRFFFINYLQTNIELRSQNNFKSVLLTSIRGA